MFVDSHASPAVRNQGSRWPRGRSGTVEEWENEGGSLSHPSECFGYGWSSGVGRLGPENRMLDALPLGVMITNPRGEITYSNPACEVIYAVPSRELLGTGWYLALDEWDRKAATSRWRESDHGHRPYRFEARMITGSGQRIWTRRSIACLGSPEEPSGHIHTIEDISELKAEALAGVTALEILSRENERARVTLQCIGDAVISTDERGHVTYLNPVAERLTGWPLDKALDVPFRQVFRVVDSDSGEPVQNPAERAMACLEIVQLAANSLLLRRDGTELAIEDSAAPIHDAQGRLTGAVVIFRDLRLSQDSMSRMAYLARHDALTGLLNRVAFAERFERAVNLARRHGGRLGLLFIDLNGFKQVNDTLGHKAGDQLLEAFSKGLCAAVRNTDTVCRYGGDEFAVLLEEIRQPEDIVRIVENIREAIARPRHIGGQAVQLTMSVGISLYPEDGGNMDTLMLRADAAMYHAKSTRGGGCLFYHPGMMQPAIRLLSLEDIANATDSL